MNKVSLTGRLTTDVELRKTATNKSVSKFSIAVDKDRKDADGNRGVDFIRVVAWESKADFLNNYAKKGTLLGVTGRVETNKYTGRDGVERTEVYVRAEQVEILKQPAEKTEQHQAKQSFTLDDLDEPWVTNDESSYY